MVHFRLSLYRLLNPRNLHMSTSRFIGGQNPGIVSTNNPPPKMTKGVRNIQVGNPIFAMPPKKIIDDSWKPVKKKFLDMKLEDKREHYFVKGNYLDKQRIRPWPVYYEKMKKLPGKIEKKHSVNFTINSRVAIGFANICALELDCIVNSAAQDMLGGGGELDQAVHAAAGPELRLECASFHGCDIGEAKLTGGYRLPSKYVIHTVGPRSEIPAQLKACYKSCLNLMKINRLHSVAFPCISTAHGYPVEAGAHVALENVRSWLQKHPDKPKMVCFAIVRQEDLEVYEKLMQVYFPCN